MRLWLYLTKPQGVRKMKKRRQLTARVWLSWQGGPPGWRRRTRQRQALELPEFWKKHDAWILRKLIKNLTFLSLRFFSNEKWKVCHIKSPSNCSLLTAFLLTWQKATFRGTGRRPPAFGWFSTCTGSCIPQSNPNPTSAQTLAGWNETSPDWDSPVSSKVWPLTHSFSIWLCMLTTCYSQLW